MRDRQPNPYVGPRAFSAWDAPKFFGREREVAALRDLLIERRIVLLSAARGAGKSSLINASLIPRLRDAEGFQVLPVIRTGLTLPPDAPTSNPLLLAAFLSLESSLMPEQQMQLADLARLSFREYLARQAKLLQLAGRSLLIFDQLEDVITPGVSDSAILIEFFRQVGEALQNPELFAIFTVRDDFETALAPYRYLIPTQLEARFHLDRLTREAALEAIIGPAASAGIPFAPGVAERLVDELATVRIQLPDGTVQTALGQYVEPVQLQVVCYSLWEHIAPGASVISHADVAAIGGTDAILRRFVADSIARAAASTNTSESDIRAWIIRELITPDGRRSQVMQDAAATVAGLPMAAVQQLVEVSLLRTEKRQGMAWYELASDRLIELLLPSAPPESQSPDEIVRA